jgi:hypothetical protein
MLSDTYTVGTAPNQWVFKKQYDDANGGYFIVDGRPSATPIKMSVKHQKTKTGVRSVVDISITNYIPGTTSGETHTSRRYQVFEDSSHSLTADQTVLDTNLDALLGVAGFLTAVHTQQR